MPKSKRQQSESQKHITTLTDEIEHLQSSLVWFLQKFTNISFQLVWRRRKVTFICVLSQRPKSVIRNDDHVFKRTAPPADLVDISRQNHQKIVGIDFLEMITRYIVMTAFLLAINRY